MLLPLGLGVRIPKFPLITLYLVILNVFFFYQSQGPNMAYVERMIKMKKEKHLAAYYKSDDLLNRKNINLTSLTKAQFTHSDLAHLGVNLLALIGFGIYVETKIGPLFFMFIYFLGGYLGLSSSSYFFLENNSVLLGSSANIFSIMGAFFVIFFRHYMKFLLFYFFTWKKILLPVKYSFPFFFVVVEVLNQLLGNQHVTLDAHLVGMIVGIIFGFLFLMFDPVKWPFIYPVEKEKFDELAGKTRFDEIEEICEDILHYNPMNYKVRFYLLTKTIERYNKNGFIDEKIDKSFRKHLERYLGKFLKDERYDLCQKILKRIPFSIPLEAYLKGVSQKKLINFGGYLLTRKMYSDLLRVYSIYFHHFSNSKNSKKILKICDSILDDIKSKEDWENIRTLRGLDSRNILIYRINKFFDMKKNGDY
tara:strand:+ start:1195 stop:2454 length:1260 start_codon:yes stop_codon:yes gene_type:complete